MAGVALYIAQRLILAVPLLIGATLAAFLLGVAAPGDPVLHLLAQRGIRNPGIEEVEMMREALGLHRPLFEQYGAWLWRFMQGDLGMSIVTERSIGAELARTLPVTLTLATMALAFALVTGVSSGIIMGYFKDGWVDHLGRLAALLLLSVPGFWLAIMLIAVFAEQLHWLPTSGWGEWRTWVLPTIVLGAGSTAVISRMARSWTLSIMLEPFVLAARGRGLGEGVVATDFILRNMLVLLLALAGTYFGGMLAGTVIVETIFAIPGAGRFAYESVLRRDYVAIQSYVALISLGYIAIGILTDIAAALVDPRVGFAGRA